MDACKAAAYHPLWCLVRDELMVRLADAGFYAQPYADDGLVQLTGKFLGVVCDRMQMACRIIEGWSEETGLSVNPSKTEMILFTKRRNLESFREPIFYGRPAVSLHE